MRLLKLYLIITATVLKIGIFHFSPVQAAQTRDDTAAPINRSPHSEYIIPKTLNRPALMTTRVRDAFMVAVARAGRRLVAVGEHGIIVWSDNNGISWHQAKVPV